MPDLLQKRLSEPTSQFLVFTSAGEHAQVHRWLRGRRNFDLWVTCYAGSGENLRRVADYYNEREGGKFPNLLFAYQSWPDLIQQYEAIFVVDDDMQISGSGISKLFEILVRYDLWVLQPSCSPMGKRSHYVTRARAFSYLRYTNFVEVNCPVFRTDKLTDFLSVFDPSLVGWGTDHWYMQHLIGDRRDKAAIVDAVIAVNPLDETKGGREIRRLQADDVRVAAWRHIQGVKKIRDVSPMREWSMIRRFGDPQFYTSSLHALFMKTMIKLTGKPGHRTGKRSEKRSEKRSDRG